MKKVFIFISLALSLFAGNTNAQKKQTVLSAQIYGYKNDMVYFDCVQTPLIRQEFYTNPGEEHIYKFDIDNNVCMLINGKTKVIMQPGDSLHVNIRYNGRNIEQLEFSGNETAVKNNNAVKDIDNIKIDMRYKSQLLGCAALDIKPKDRINDSRILLERAKATIDQAQLSKDVANYIIAGIESEAYLSFMEYPVMYASVRGTAIEKQEIGDYWSIMNDVTIRKDAASLNNPEYVSLLMRYAFYINEKRAIETGNKYHMPARFEDMYNELSEFYTDEQRDYVLYTLLCNFIRNGQEIERADALFEDYKEKYNKNKTHIEILETILQ